MKEKIPTGRLIAHPDILHLQAIIENNKRECVAVDKILGKIWARRSTTGIGSAVHDKKRYVAPTLHDLATSNPLLRDILRELQKTTR